jgi:hypothetical protein
MTAAGITGLSLLPRIKPRTFDRKLGSKNSQNADFLDRPTHIAPF